MNTELIPSDPDQPDEALPAPIPGLTHLQSQFVRCYVEHGDGNATRAATEAGYAAVSAAAMGYRLLRKPEIMSAIQQETAMQLGSHAPMALHTMKSLLNAKSELVRQTAAADLLNRAGFKPPDRHQHVVSGQVVISIDLGD